MATTTTFLGLVLPANNEFFNTWDTVVNENFVKVEAKIKENNDEIIASRFSLPSLNEFLAVSHNTDGTLKATGETVNARNSRVYGHRDANGLFTLEQRIRLNDFENFYARRGAASIRDGLALKAENLILNGAKTALGQPSWLGFTGANARLDGSATQIDMLVNGNYQRIRALEEITLSGAAATYFLYAEYSAEGEVKVDGDSTTSPPATPSGTTGNDVNSEIRIFADATVDFTTFDVKAGDILRILGNNSVAGDYVIEPVAAESNYNYLLIKGVFPASQAALDYVVLDSYKPTLGFAADDTPAAGRLYLGEADFDGGSITAIRPRQFKNLFVGDWRPVDLSGVATDFEEVWNHFLGDDVLDITVQVSVGDGSGGAPNGALPVEHLSLAEYEEASYSLSNTLGVNNTLSLSVGDQTFSGDVTLSGTVTLNKDTDGKMVRSVRAKHTKNQITVKNVVSDVFYTDFDSNVIQTGFVRVIVSRKDV